MWTALAFMVCSSTLVRAVSMEGTFAPLVQSAEQARGAHVVLRALLPLTAVRT